MSNNKNHQDALQALADLKIPNNNLNDDRRDLLEKHIDRLVSAATGYEQNNGEHALAVYDRYKAQFSAQKQQRDTQLTTLPENSNAYKIQKSFSQQMDKIEHNMLRQLTDPTYFMEVAQSKIANIDKTLARSKAPVMQNYEKNIAALEQKTPAAIAAKQEAVMTQQWLKQSAKNVTALESIAKSAATPASTPTAKAAPVAATAVTTPAARTTPTPKPAPAHKKDDKKELQAQQQVTAKKQEESTKDQKLLVQLGGTLGKITGEIAETMAAGLVTVATFATTQLINLTKAAIDHLKTDITLNDEQNAAMTTANDQKNAALTTAAPTPTPAPSNKNSSSTNDDSNFVKATTKVGEVLGFITNIALTGAVTLANAALHGLSAAIKSGYHYLADPSKEQAAKAEGTLHTSKQPPAASNALACAAQKIIIESPKSDPQPEIDASKRTKLG